MIVLDFGDTMIRFQQPFIPANAMLIAGNSPWVILPGPAAHASCRLTIANNSDFRTFPKTTRPAVRRFLVLFWQDFSMSWWYFQDIFGANIAGFIPLGIVFSLLFFQYGKTSFFNILAVTLYGGFISLTIELLQAFIPYRDSQLSDLLCNIAGHVSARLLS